MERTTDSIIEGLRKTISEPGSIMNPELWMEAAFDLNLLLGKESEKLFELQQQVYEMEGTEYLKDSKSTAAKSRVRATQTYRDYELQRAKVKQVEEFIRLAKIRGKMASGSY